MLKYNFKKFIFYICILFIIFTFDRLTKLYVINTFNNIDKAEIYINEFLNIMLIWNSGIGFGLFSSNESFYYHLITSLIIFINILIIYLSLTADKIRSNMYVIILGGSLGNLFDRLYYSAVPDFIDLNYNGLHWFIFNVADIFISIGIFCLIFIEILDYKNKKNEK